MRNRPPTEAALSIVQHTQAIEQMLNARCWPRMFFREQNPKPISYFRTDFGVVVCIEVGEISLGHCTSLMQFALPNTPSGRAGNRSGRKYKSEHWFGCVPQKEHTECARWGCFRLGTSRQSMPFWTRCRDSSGITRNFPAPVCPLYWGRFLFVELRCVLVPPLRRADRIARRPETQDACRGHRMAGERDSKVRTHDAKSADRSALSTSTRAKTTATISRYSPIKLLPKNGSRKTIPRASLSSMR